MDNFKKNAELKLLKGFVEAFEGDSKTILEKIQKLYFRNEETSTYKRLPSHIKKDVIELCEEYKLLKSQ